VDHLKITPSDLYAWVCVGLVFAITTHWRQIVDGMQAMRLAEGVEAQERRPPLRSNYILPGEFSLTEYRTGCAIRIRVRIWAPGNLFAVV
jgi:hypothetical protein